MTRAGRLVGAAAVVLALVGCGGGAQELLDTGQLEEVQNNHPHARDLYREIIRRYPGSAAARTAEERLRALEAAG